MTENPLAFLSLVKLLEESVGHKTSYALLDPFPCKTLDADESPGIVAIQNAGSVISRHIGLRDHVFVISVAPQKTNVAAHIELDHSSKDVFVELSPDVCRFKDAVLATLSHELSHKFLHLHGIKVGVAPIEQEFLTDVTAVYLGMGKIMLNGCHCRSTRQWTEGRQTKTQTRELKTGYISRDCFAFVYRLICGMRRIEGPQFLSGLSAESVTAIQRIESEYADWFNNDYRDHSGAAALSSALNEMLESCQDEVAERHRSLRRAEMRIGFARERVNGSHKSLLEAQEKIIALSGSEHNPHLAFLRCLEGKVTVEQLIEAGRSEARNALSAWKQVESIALLANPAAGDHGPKEIVECPLDGVKLRVPAGRRRLRVTCPKCKYKFLINTAVVSAEGEGQPVRKRPFNLLERLAALFGRKPNLS